MAKRMRTKLREIKEQLKATRQDGIDARKWLAQAPAGMDGLLCCADERLRDLGIPASQEDRTLAWRAGTPRSQRHRLTWTRE